MDIPKTNAQIIDQEREIRAAAYTYRFEKFARENGFLCHKDHYDKYFKPSIIPFWKILLSPSSPKLGLRKGHIKVFFRLKWYFGISINSTHVESPINAKVQSEATSSIAPPTT
ncbi:MAG: hypothetical protein ACKO3R_00110 [bacterium]